MKLHSTFRFISPRRPLFRSKVCVISQLYKAAQRPYGAHWLEWARLPRLLTHNQILRSTSTASAAARSMMCLPVRKRWFLSFLLTLFSRLPWTSRCSGPKCRSATDPWVVVGGFYLFLPASLRGNHLAVISTGRRLMKIQTRLFIISPLLLLAATHDYSDRRNDALIQHHHDMMGIGKGCMRSI